MKKDIISKVLVYFMIFTLIALTGCSKAAATEFDENADFGSLVAQAKGTTVTFYGWGGDESRNKWLDTTVSSTLKTKYDITLKRVPMDIDQVLSQLSGEKQAGKKKGSIDIIWINGENFFSAKENGFLYGPFTDKLPNYGKYIDKNSAENQYDFGYPIEGYEAPYGKAQMVLINDSAVTPETPKNTEELLAYVKKYPGKITYPALPDFTGSAFVRTIIYDIVGYEQFMTMDADKEKVREAILPALEYLQELNPYLWNEGKTFPATSSQVDNMFSDGELVMNMSYEPYSLVTRIEEGAYPETALTFLFDKGTVGNTNYMAIAANSSNKAGAIVTINEMIAAELQTTQFSELKSLPVVAYEMLTEEEKTRFDSIDMGKGTLPQDELLAKRLPEMPANLVPIIEEIWLEEVVGR